MKSTPPWHLISNIAYMRCLYLVLLLTIGPFISGSRGQCELKGKVLDENRREAVQRAHISLLGTTKGAYTNTQGEFALNIPCGQSIEIEISSINYLTLTKTISSEDLSSGQIIIHLEFNIYELDAASVVAAPDTVHGSESYHVADFAFVGDGGMLLLAYGKEKRWKRQEDQSTTIYDKCRLVWLDSLERKQDEYFIHSSCIGFYIDYMDEIFLETTEKKLRVEIRDDKISVHPISANEFDKYIEPVIDSIGDFVYVTSYNPVFPAFEYYGINKADSTFHHLHYVVDEPLMEMFRSEYKYLDPRGKLEAFRYEVQHGVEKEVVGAYMSGFAKSDYFEPLYAPFFVWKDTVMIFDHYHDKLVKFNKFNELIDSVAISYHRDVRRSEWQKKITLDDNSGSIYGVFKRAGYFFLREIDTESGIPQECFKLTHRYADSIRVRNGWAYYVYRPFESAQKKFLYKEVIHNNSVFGRS